MMAAVCWGCVYGCCLLVALCAGLPQYLCFRIFVAVLFTLLPVGFAIDRTQERWHKKRNNRLQFTA